MTATRVERMTLHLINDHDRDETYQVQILHVVDGRVIGYRVDPADAGGFTFTPLENGMAEEIAEWANFLGAR